MQSIWTSIEMFRKRNISKSSISVKSSGTWTTDHFMQCGEFIARMDNSLKTFSHKAYESRSVIPKKNMRWIQKIYNHSIWLRFRNSIWFLSSIPEVKNFIGAVEDEGRKKLVRKDEKKCHHCHHHHHQLNTGDGDYGRVLRHRSACGQSAGTGLDEQLEIRNFTRLLM